jgi:uncharacterized membrane protein YbaN (DUF454 family)
MRKVILIVLGIICTILGVIGVLLPVMPGVIFFVMAAFFFSKSSRTLHQHLLNLPYIGQSIKDWENYGVMTFQTKAGLVFFFIMSFLSSAYFTTVNYGYPIIIFNFVIVGTFMVMAIDKKLK